MVVLCRAAKSMLLQGSKIAVPASCKQRQKRKLNLYLAKRKKKRRKGSAPDNHEPNNCKAKQYRKTEHHKGLVQSAGHGDQVNILTPSKYSGTEMEQDLKWDLRAKPRITLLFTKYLVGGRGLRFRVEKHEESWSLGGWNTGRVLLLPQTTSTHIPHSADTPQVLDWERLQQKYNCSFAKIKPSVFPFLPQLSSPSKAPGLP